MDNEFIGKESTKRTIWTFVLFIMFCIFVIYMVLYFVDIHFAEFVEEAKKPVDINIIDH